MTAPPLFNFQAVFADLLLPWTEEKQTSHILVLPANGALPAGVLVTPKPVRGPRQRRKNFRSGGQISFVLDVWPESNLNTKTAPVLLWVLAGRAEVHVGSQNVQCDAGHLLVIPAGLPHPIGSEPYGPPSVTNSVLMLRVCGRGFRAYVTHTAAGKIISPRPGESLYFTNEQINSLFVTLCEALIDGPRSKYCFHSLMHLLLTLQRELLEGRAFNIALTESTDAVNPRSRPNEYSPIEEAKAYVSSHFGESLTIEGMARRVHMSRSNFARLFRQETGRTFLEYVHDRRLEQATAVLRDTEWTVRTVSELCGFTNCSSFNRLFLKRTGMTPLTYRSSHRATAKSAP